MNYSLKGFLSLCSGTRRLNALIGRSVFIDYAEIQIVDRRLQYLRREKTIVKERYLSKRAVRGAAKA